MSAQSAPGETTPGSRDEPRWERLSDALPSLLPLAQQYVDDQRRGLELRERAFARDQARDDRWKWQMALVAIGCLVVIAIAVGLIFYLGEVTAGLIVLSHLAALGAGAIAGAGWLRRQLGSDRRP